MKAPVELQHGADGIASFALLTMPALGTDPQPLASCFEPPSERIGVDGQMMILLEHLGKECRSIIGIQLMVQPESLRAQLGRVSPVGSLTPQSMNEACIPLA